MARTNVSSHVGIDVGIMAICGAFDANSVTYTYTVM